MWVKYQECNWDNLEYNGEVGVFLTVHIKDVGLVTAEVSIWFID